MSGKGMQSTPRRSLYTVVLAIVLAFGLSTPAFATIRDGAWRNTGSYAGENYKNRSSGGTASSGASFFIEARTRTTGNACSACMGVKIRAYDSGGSLIYQSSWLYNNGPSSGYSRGWNTDDYGGRFYSKGQTRYWNGDTYSGTWNSYASPTFTYS